jgi:hypothetical protein
MLYDFELAGEKVRLWQRIGESYEHVLLKALGYAMFAGDFPNLEIEKKVGLRYKPDLVAQNENGEFVFWGEAGDNSLRKTMWLLKHARVEKLVLLKLASNKTQLVKQLREEIPPRYRENGKLFVINFTKNIVALTSERKIKKVYPEWFTKTIV